MTQQPDDAVVVRPADPTSANNGIPPWQALGLGPANLREWLRTMLMARLLDQRAQQLNHQGRAAFTVSGAGHEAAQVGVASALRQDLDWSVPYYRDLALALQLGTTPLEFLLSVLAKPADRSSGGKQTPGKYSDRSLRMLSCGSPVATQFPHAVGIAYSLKMDGGGGVALVSCGEGGSSEGDTHEAFNFASVHRVPVIFFFQNNGFAISTPATSQYAVEHLASRASAYGFPGVTVNGRDPVACFAAARIAVERARAGEGPTLIEAIVDRLGPHSSEDDPKKYRTAEDLAEMEANDCVKTFGQLLIDSGVAREAELEELRVGVQAEIDAATNEALAHPDAVGEDALTNVYDRNTPRPLTPPPNLGTVEQTMIESIRTTLTEEMDRDDRVMVLGEDVGAKGGVFLATVGLFERFGGVRVIDTPLAESSIAGVSLGLAAAGKRPIAEMQFADFAYLAYSQIVNEIAKLRYRTNGDWSAPLVIRAPIGGHVRGGLYHSQSIEARFATPGLKIVVPSTPSEAKGLLLSAIRDPDPVLFLEHKRLYRMFKEAVPQGEYLLPLGSARVAREGSDVVVVTYGLMVHYTLQAAEALEREGISVEVLDLRTVYPLDTEAILDSVRRIGKVLVVYEENLSVAIGSEVSAVIGEGAFESLDAPIRRLGGLDVPAMPFAQAMEDFFMPSPTKIADAIRDLYEF